MRVLIVDDEEPARAKLRRLLSQVPGITGIQEALDGNGAVSAIETERPDLVLLDVQMPGLDGFGVIEQVGAGRMPPVIFVTAHDAHAVQAFEVHALDYLLKPVSPERFRRAIHRVAGLSDAGIRLDALLETLGRTGGFAQRIMVEDDRRALFLAVDRIDRIHSERNYVRIVAGADTYRLRISLAALLARLDPERFLQINRGDIVRLDAVKELHPWSHGDYRIVMRDGTELSWSRRYRSRANRVLGA
jgi:two-component system LytT family response regulator